MSTKNTAKLSKEEVVSNTGIDEAGEPKNPIKGIDEIPQVLKEEGVEQPVIYLKNNINGKKRSVVLLGETHIATEGEERAADRILSHFKYIGCEGIDTRTFIEGKFFFWVMDHILGRILDLTFFFEKRSVKNKTSLEKAQGYLNSKTKKVFLLEKGWKPNIRIRIFSIVFPLWIFYSLFEIIAGSVEVTRNYGGEGFVMVAAGVAVLVTLFYKLPLIKDFSEYIVWFIIDRIFDIGPSRNKNMMKNLMAEMNKDQAISEIIVISGSGHTKSLAKLLKGKYGFVETGSYLKEIAR